MKKLSGSLKPLTLITVFGTALLLTGCGRSALGGVGESGYDRAACIENALRHNPDKQLLLTAAAQLGGACADGEAPSCSALGVMNELGLAMPVNPGRALELYRKACHGDSARGCVNLGRAILQGRGVAAHPKRAEGLFAGACAAGEMYGCAELGKMKVASAPAPGSLEARYGRELLARACDADERSACRAYGEVLESLQPREALVVYTKACLQGDAAACRRMDAPLVRTEGEAAAGWRSR